MKTQPAPVSQDILPLWRKGFNTYDIARALNLPEYEVANRLMGLREAHKQMRGGGTVCQIR